MAMPQGPFGTLHDLVSLYAKKAQAIPQLVTMHYAVEVKTTSSSGIAQFCLVNLHVLEAHPNWSVHKVRGVLIIIAICCLLQGLNLPRLGSPLASSKEALGSG